MRIKKYLGILIALIVCGTANAGYELEMKSSEFRVNVHSEFSYNGRSNEIGAKHSHIQLQWLNNKIMNVSQAIQLFKKNGAKEVQVRKIILGITAKLSGAPFIIRDSAEEGAHAVADARALPYIKEIATKEAMLNSQIELAIDSFLLDNPHLAPYRDSLIEDARAAQQPLFDQLAAANAQVNAQVAGAKDEISDRVDELVSETAIQEVALELGYVLEGKYLGDKEVALFARMGKLKVNGGSSTNENNSTSLEEITAQNILAQRATNTSGTTAAQFITIFRAEQYSVQTDVYLFHDRLPWLNANQYITSVLSMENDDWKRHDDLGEIDSAMVRWLLEYNRLSVNFSAGSYDGENAFGAGVKFKVTQKDTLYLDYFSGKRKNVAGKKANGQQATATGLSIQLDHQFEKLPLLGSNPTGWVGFESYQNVVAPQIIPGSERLDYQQTGLGLSKKKKLSLLGQGFDVTTKFGLYKLDGEAADTGEEVKDNYGAASINIEW